VKARRRYDEKPSVVSATVAQVLRHAPRTAKDRLADGSPACYLRAVANNETGSVHRFRDLLEIAPDSMVVADQTGRILLANLQIQELLGYEPGELIGQPLEMLLPERFRARHVEHRAGYAGDPRPRAMGAKLDLFARRKDGSEVPVEISLSPMHEPEGLVTIAALRDISERKQAEAERERAAREREELLSLLSHDLQNSINALSLNTQLLLRVKASSEGETRMRRYGLVVGRTADTMSRLVRDMLDVQRMELGQFSIDAQPEPVIPLVEEAIEPLRAVADEKSVKIDTRLDDAAGSALCDRGRIVQVLHNLVGNAIKFVPAGGQVVVETGREPANVRFTVEDNGPGIEPDDLPYVFDRHWQATSNTLRRGSGLGLFIVKTIVEAHEGAAWARSTPGSGASFYFTLPVEAAR
jgi:protein-histidine pros-kinase